MRRLGIVIVLVLGLAVLAFGVWALITPGGFVQTFWGEPERYWSSEEFAFVIKYAVNLSTVRGLGIMGLGLGGALITIAWLIATHKKPVEELGEEGLQ